MSRRSSLVDFATAALVLHTAACVPADAPETVDDQSRLMDRLENDAMAALARAGVGGRN